MGLDMHLVAAHNKKEVESENFWRDLPDYSELELYSENYQYDRPAILCYWRKFWDLHTMIANKYGLKNGEWTKISRNDLEKIINFAIHNPDYWDSFKSIPQLCTILFHYNELNENGLSLFYEGDF